MVAALSVLLRICCTLPQLKTNQVSSSFTIANNQSRRLLISTSTTKRRRPNHFLFQNTCLPIAQTTPNIVQLFINSPSKESYYSCKSISNNMQYEIKTFNEKHTISHYHFESCHSTQDEAKQQIDLLESSSNSIITVTASSQTKGRGTRGRIWKSSQVGNLLLTIAIPADLILVPLTLLPLQMGTIVAKVVQNEVKNERTTVKWPNDVLLNKKKIAGILIEYHLDYFLVGIGCNVRHAPKIESIGAQRGRPSTCLYDYETRLSTVEQVGDLITEQVVRWIYESQQLKSKKQLQREVIEEWSSWFDFEEKYVLRDEDNAVVYPAGIELDGTLRVREENGDERLLIADYLF